MKKNVSWLLVLLMLLTALSLGVFANSTNYYDIDGVRHGNAVFWIRIHNNQWEFKAVDNRKPKSADYKATVWVDGVKVYSNTAIRDGVIVTGRAEENQYSYGTHTIKVELVMLNHTKVYIEQGDWGSNSTGGNNVPTTGKSMLGRLNYPNNGILNGWALIPDNITETAEIVFYADGPLGQGSFLKTIPANLPDLNLYWNQIVNSYNNINHAFEIKLSEMGLGAGTRWIYAYAIDPSGKAATTEIGRYQVSTANMQGSLDEYEDGLLKGWAVIPNNLWANARIEFYVDEPKGEGILIHSTYADKDRYDLYTNGIVSSSANIAHGFEVDIQDFDLAPGERMIYVYAVDPFSGNNNTVEIGSTEVNIGLIEQEAPVLSYELSITEWTKKDVTINLTVTDESGIKWIHSLSDLSWKSGNNKKSIQEAYNAWTNGDYVFEVIDINNNVKQYTVPVNNIDKEGPFGFFCNLRNENGNTYVDLVAIDVPGTGLSGLKTIKYGYNNGRGVGNYPAEWTTIVINEQGQLIKNIPILINGKDNKFVFIYLEDHAGNVFAPKLGYGPFKGSTVVFDFMEIKADRYFDQNLGKYCYRLEPSFSESNIPIEEYKWEIISGSDKMTLYNSSADDPIITVTDQNGGGTAIIRLSVRIGKQWFQKEITITLGTPVSINLSEQYKKVQQVEVTINFLEDAAIKQYKIGETGQWIDYTSPFKIIENTTIYARVIDNKGAEYTTSCQIINIDRIAPIGTIIYSKTEPTNEDVVAVIVFDEEEEDYIDIISGDGSDFYTFSENGEYVFAFMDQAGNIGTAVAKVNNIDKIAPTAIIQYSTAAKTKDDVVAVLIPSEQIIVINNDNSSKYTFTCNNEFVFEFKDLAGNIGTAKAIVNNIDKDPPTGTFSYSTTEPTKENVIVTLIPSENITVTNNDGALTYTFTNNGVFTFHMLDEVENAGFATVRISNIDREVDAYVEYSTELPTYGEVTATLKANESIIIINNNQLSSYTFSENGEFVFEVADALGNTAMIKAVVSNIQLAALQDISMIQLKSTISGENKTSVIQGGSLPFIVKLITDKNGQLALELDCLDMNILDSIDCSQEFFSFITVRETIKDQYGNVYTLEPANDGSKRFVLKSSKSLDKGIEYQIKIVISISESLPKDSYQLKVPGTNQTLQINVIEIPPLL